jgi:hypothetical protein
MTLNDGSSLLEKYVEVCSLFYRYITRQYKVMPRIYGMINPLARQCTIVFEFPALGKRRHQWRLIFY